MAFHKDKLNTNNLGTEVEVFYVGIVLLFTFFVCLCEKTKNSMAYLSATNKVSDLVAAARLKEIISLF